MSYKILIANRGEIALRAMRACKELGLQTVAVYSNADKDLKHLKFADETVCIGPASPTLSYLNVASILSAAELTEANAIYPGYGFLAEDPNFAEMCEKSGFKFIGPSSDIIRKMGDKITAKTLAEKSGIQIVPGYKGDLPDDKSELSKIVNRIGYPIMIKATAGGGGRGMRMVRDESELFNSLEVTIQEALNAFGNVTVYLEKFIEYPFMLVVSVIDEINSALLSKEDVEFLVGKYRINHPVILAEDHEGLKRNPKERLPVVKVVRNDAEVYGVFEGEEGIDELEVQMASMSEGQIEVLGVRTDEFQSSPTMSNIRRAMSYPTAIQASNKYGEWYVTDTNNNRILIVDSDGQICWLIELTSSPFTVSVALNTRPNYFIDLAVTINN